MGSKKAIPTQDHRILLIFHVYWPSRFNVALPYINRITLPMTIIITIPRDSSVEEIEVSLSKVANQHRVILKEVDNFGRDVGALFQIFEEISRDEWDIIIKLHTKASQRNWYKVLLKSHLKSDSRIVRQIMTLKRFPKSIIAHPLLAYPGHLHLSDEPAFARLVEACFREEQESRKKWYFAAGTMFSITPSFLHEVFEAGRRHNFIHFEIENEYSQASMAHVYERFFGLHAYRRGNGLFATSIFDYFDFRALLVKIL